MDVNGVIRQGSPIPQASSAVRSPKPETQDTAPERPRPVARDTFATQTEEQAQPAKRSIVVQDESKIRGGTRLRLDPATNRVVAQIVNKNNEVIKQVPPEEALRIAARFRQLTGLIFDLKV